jgi:hypothetical protein
MTCNWIPTFTNVKNIQVQRINDDDDKLYHP